MTIIRINAIDVAEGNGDELARRFQNRAHAVDTADGFEGFELLRPTDGRATWLVVTRWRSEEDFDRWVASPAFAHGHRGDGPPADGHGHGHGHGQGQGQGSEAGDGAPAPVATSSELWSYTPVPLD